MSFMCNLLNDKKISELCFHNYYITDLPIVNNLFFDGFQPSFEFLKILKQGENKRTYWLIQYVIERYTAPSYYLQSNYNFSAFPTLASGASIARGCPRTIGQKPEPTIRRRTARIRLPCAKGAVTEGD